MIGRRKKPSLAVARDIIEQQTGRCGYCNRGLASIQMEWDHFIPFCYTQTSLPDNWVASCHDCNMSKQNRHLTTVDAVYDFCFEMTVRHGEIGEGWPEGSERT